MRHLRFIASTQGNAHLPKSLVRCGGFISDAAAVVQRSNGVGLGPSYRKVFYLFDRVEANDGNNTGK